MFDLKHYLEESKIGSNLQSLFDIITSLFQLASLFSGVRRSNEDGTYPPIIPRLPILPHILVLCYHNSDESVGWFGS